VSRLTSNLTILSQTKPIRGEKKETPPPRVSPPTPTLADLPPPMAIPSASSLEYTSAHRLPGPTVTVERSLDGVTWSSRLKSIVIPCSIFAAPANGVWLAKVSHRSRSIGTGDIPSTSHGKVTLSRQSLASDVQERDCDSNVAACSRCNKTCGIHISLLSAPVGRQRFVVTCTARVEDLLRERKFQGSTLRQSHSGQLLQRALSLSV
jgi:hypothetical protein